MSFIQQTIKCKCAKCGFQMNVSTGTFGQGIPEYCPECKRKLIPEVISDGWNAENNKKMKNKFDSWLPFILYFCIGAFIAYVCSVIGIVKTLAIVGLLAFLITLYMVWALKVHE